MKPSHDTLKRLAARIDCILPALLRRICTLDGPRVELPLAQLRLCAVLLNGPLTMSVLSRELGTTVSATTQLADRLEAIGFVERVAEPVDRRTRHLRLTPRGAEVMERSRTERLRRWSEILGHVPAERRESLLESLEALVEASKAAFPSPEGGVEALAGATEILMQAERA